jgi:hypothetical protein
MSWQSGSDVGIEFLLVARDGIRFRFVGLRYRPGEYPADDTPPKQALPARELWIQVATPPPNRVDGSPWDLMLSEPNSTSLKDMPKLTRPEPGAIVLDRRFSAPFVWGMEVEFSLAEQGDPDGFIASYYEQPKGLVGVNHYGEYTLDWTRELNEGDWVAVSFDHFDPEAHSTAFLARVTDRWLFRPPPTAG